jgi:hypothetical protein
MGVSHKDLKDEYQCGQPTTQGAKVTQKTQKRKYKKEYKIFKKSPKNIIPFWYFFVFFCALCEIFAPSAFGCPLLAVGIKNAFFTSVPLQIA